MFGNSKSKQPRRVISEDQLHSYEQEDSYKRKKWLLDSTTVVLVAAIGAMPLILLAAIIASADVRNKVVDLTVTNLPGLLYAGLVITGIRIKGSEK